MRASVVDRLCQSDEPSIRWKIRVHALGEDPKSRTNRKLREEIRTSWRVRRILEGEAEARRNVYSKWRGAHWALMALGDLGYPVGDSALQPLVDREFRTWLSLTYRKEYDPDEDQREPGKNRLGVPLINGRYRRCGSQQGGALLAVVQLGLEGEKSAHLVERLIHWQWPDGGWNCDRDPAASSSSLNETLLPMRGLAAYAQMHSDGDAMAAARRAAEVLLTRRLIFRRRDGQLIRSDMASLHYPVYWRYDLLAGLKGLAESGYLGDPRCQDALDLLESKRLPDGGWAAQARYYSYNDGFRASPELVDWGGADTTRMNEWVTADALAVLRAAGRMLN